MGKSVKTLLLIALIARVEIQLTGSRFSNMFIQNRVDRVDRGEEGEGDPPHQFDGPIPRDPTELTPASQRWHCKDGAGPHKSPPSIHSIVIAIMWDTAANNMAINYADCHGS